MSSPLIPAALGANMQQGSPDQTSAPPDNPPSVQNPVIQALNKKKKGFGAGVRNPGALAGAIARAKKARQFGQKWGN